MESQDPQGQDAPQQAENTGQDPQPNPTVAEPTSDPTPGATAVPGQSGQEAEGTVHPDPADSSPTDAADQQHPAPDADQPGDTQADPATQQRVETGAPQADEVDQPDQGETNPQDQS